jgi:hypothetical protein
VAFEYFLIGACSTIWYYVMEDDLKSISSAVLAFCLIGYWFLWMMLGCCLTAKVTSGSIYCVLFWTRKLVFSKEDQLFWIFLPCLYAHWGARSLGVDFRYSGTSKW